MAQFFHKAATFLGLVSDDQDDEYGADVEQFSERIYTSEIREDSVVTPIRGGRAGAGDRMETTDLSRIITVNPRTYNEARTIGEHFRDGVPVIMNLTEMDDADAKRLIDFSAGLIFGLRGTIERITNRVFLLSPNKVNVTAEDKERIKGGFYNQS